MSEIITYATCPACGSGAIKPVLEAEDYTVSHETFSIWECDACTLRFTQNVPALQDIGKYYQSAAYVSHSDTKKGLINRLYHIVRNYTLQSKRKLVETVTRKSSGSLLDIGAGTGAFAATMKAGGWQITGLEPDDIARTNARNQHGLELQSPDRLFQLPANSFDIITMWHVLEHVHSLHEYLDTFGKILKQDGHILIAVPNYTSGDAQQYGAYWAAYDVPRHLYHFSPKSMQLLLAKHGFTVTEHKPMWFDSYYVSMLSEQYKNGKSNLPGAFFAGRKSNRNAGKSYDHCSSVIYVIKRA
ncbi:MAG: methyltransferase domain-containing protein [Filimonas sp.]|nr:methyltransferase domain-containing protein [Filimonas sp.]